eukprot:Skav230180  [mRNA]  locus=scaffold196:131041:135655:- [translate_table: standard]
MPRSSVHPTLHQYEQPSVKRVKRCVVAIRRGWSCCHRLPGFLVLEPAIAANSWHNMGFRPEPSLRWTGYVSVQPVLHLYRLHWREMAWDGVATLACSNRGQMPQISDVQLPLGGCHMRRARASEESNAGCRPCPLQQGREEYSLESDPLNVPNLAAWMTTTSWGYGMCPTQMITDATGVCCASELGAGTSCQVGMPRGSPDQLPLADATSEAEAMGILSGRPHPEGDRVHVMSAMCRLPGNGCSPDQYWSMLLDGTDGMVGIPSARWDTDIYCSKDQEFVIGKCYAMHGGFVA